VGEIALQMNRSTCPGNPSSFRILPCPLALPNRQFTGLLRLTENVSSDSTRLSPTIETSNDAVSEPGENTSVPEAGRKSMPDAALPPAVWKSIVTVLSQVLARLTVNPTFTIDAFSSDTLASLIDTAGGEYFMVVEAVAELLALFPSACAAETEAVFTTVPIPGGITLIVTRALPPAAKLPTDAVTVPPENPVLPCEAEAETKLTPGGSVSETTTPVAAAGPLFITRMS
jgi:hypothetical protein